eukprot:747426-Rhodomonas_salina.2
MCGTDLAYGATGRLWGNATAATKKVSVRYWHSVWLHVLCSPDIAYGATRCSVLAYRSVLA